MRTVGSTPRTRIPANGSGRGGWLAPRASSAAWLRVGDTAGPLVGDDEEERLVEFAKWKPIRLGDLRPHANFSGVRLLRVNHRIGLAAFLDPQTRVVGQLVKTTRLDRVDADLSVHPPMAMVVSPGGSIAHPDQRAGRIFVGDDRVGPHGYRRVDSGRLGDGDGYRG